MERQKPPPLSQGAAARAVSSWLAAVARLVKRVPPGWRVLALGAFVVAGLSFISGIQSSSPGASQIASDTKQFSISNQPTLVFAHFVGHVTIMPGSDGQVSIKEKRSGETDSIVTAYAQHGDTITVTSDIPGGRMEDTWGDFDVSVPRHAGFKTTVATGTLEARNLGGHIALTNTNGAIWATNLTGSLNVKTQSGAITFTNVTGEVAASTQNGTITSTGTLLQGHSTIQAESGTINFHGSLGRAGRHMFSNTNGAVGLTLPANSAFTVAARTNSGSINADFPGVRVSHQEGRSVALGVVGAAPTAQLTIQTSGGPIDLHPAR